MSCLAAEHRAWRLPCHGGWVASTTLLSPRRCIPQPGLAAYPRSSLPMVLLAASAKTCHRHLSLRHYLSACGRTDNWISAHFGALDDKRRQIWLAWFVTLDIINAHLLPVRYSTISLYRLLTRCEGGPRNTIRRLRGEYLRIAFYDDACIPRGGARSTLPRRSATAIRRIFLHYR